eukprot:gb/GECG01002731.1/.p1 GENE.gb/GECG01002731.1/~~gb/GECG01002731.1/.p1  ORF type:complete len:758 (+),score=125.32 gb/GECG01002731.1/:1-2274(+)
MSTSQRLTAGSKQEAKEDFRQKLQQVEKAKRNRKGNQANKNASLGRSVLGAVTNVVAEDTASVPQKEAGRPPRPSRQQQTAVKPQANTSSSRKKGNTAANSKNKRRTSRTGSQTSSNSGGTKRRKRAEAVGSADEEDCNGEDSDQPSSPEPEIQFGTSTESSTRKQSLRNLSTGSLEFGQMPETPTCLLENADESQLPSDVKELMRYAVFLKRKVKKYEEAGSSSYSKVEEERRKSVEQTINLANSVRSTSDMQMEICRLQKQLKEYKASNSNSNEASSRAGQKHKKQLDESNHKVEELSTENQKLRDQKEELETTIERKNESIRELEGKLEQKQQETEELRKREGELTDRYENAIHEKQQADEEAKRCVAEAEKFRKQYEEVEQERLKLREELLDLRGEIRVFCRVRPLLPGEAAKGNGKGNIFTFPQAKADGTTRIQMLDHSRSKNVAGDTVDAKAWPFDFNRVFTPQNDQQDVFHEVCPVVESCLSGYRACLFAYGQTGAGKTYTMLGNPADIQHKTGAGSEESFGIIPRSVQHLFHQIEIMHSHGWESQLSAQMLEIYNEQIYDLLGKQKKTNLDVKIDKDGEPSIPGLTQHNVTNLSEIWELIQLAAKSRATSSTSCNEESSRSHAVFTLKVNVTHRESGEHREGQLHLIDLAGSERISKTGTSGTTMKEAQSINKSLSTLGKVVAALASKAKHVPFRDSKLTRLLQPSLSNSQNCKALMICNLSPVEEHAQESLCTLRFAQSVAQCTLKQK